MHKTDKALAALTRVAEEIIEGERPKISGAEAPTFEAFAKEWTSGDLHKKDPDHVRDKDAARDEEVLRLYINPVIGQVRIADVTLDHAEAVMVGLPRKLAPRTRKLVAQCMRRVQCSTVLLERRIAYGVLTREGMRASELQRLQWRDVDLEPGRVKLDENKTDDPRAWALSPDVVRALKWWKEKKGGGDADLVIGLDLGDGARWLRGKKEDPKKHPGDLRLAGITRLELFEDSPSRQPLRLHDLRATFVTVSLANGKTEQWVTDRTGHKSSQMVSLYARQARTWAELNLGQLRPLDELLPEMKKGITGAEGASGHGSGEGGGAADWATNGPQSGPRSKRSTGGAFEIVNDSSGGEGIRTPGSVAATAVFKTAAFDHSATPPNN